MSRKILVWLSVGISVATAAILLVSCSGGSGNDLHTANPALVNVTVSDPTTCSAPQGPFRHIFVTITDVQVNTNSSAGDHDSGWIDLTPNLASTPQQVDLLGQANNQCFVAMLGSQFQLQPGSYQQIRIMLAGGSVTLSKNQCGSMANCVMLTSDSSGTPQPLLLSSQAQTGIKIPAGQIAGGQFVIAAGQTKDLNIDFDACASIVTEGNGQFRMKPVLHAGEVQLTSSSINGKVVDSVTGASISGGKTVVALEQKDTSGVDRVVMEAVPDITGAFVFCPVAAGTYDIVVTAVNAAGAAYGATVITGVQPGDALGTVPLTAASGMNTAAASITGQITSTTGSAGTIADISLSLLQTITVNGANVMITVPLASQSAAMTSVATAAGTSCPAKTDCATYTLSVAAVNPSVGAFSTSGVQKPAAPASGSVNYTVDAVAFVPGGSNTLDCNPSEMQTSSNSTNTALTVTPGTSVTAATLAFTGCQ